MYRSIADKLTLEEGVLETISHIVAEVKHIEYATLYLVDDVAGCLWTMNSEGERLRHTPLSFTTVLVLIHDEQ